MTQNTVTERELEEQKLEEIIAIAQNNLDKARESIKQMDEDIAELYSTLDMDDTFIQCRRSAHAIDA